MRKSLILLCMFFITGCIQQPELSEKQLVLIRAEAEELLLLSPNPKFYIDYSGQSNIKKLKPERVYVTKDGLYIELHSSFSTETGLFVPRDGVNIDTGEGLDPAYRELKNKVYSYEIKG
ncbi:hypothetical protein [Microbulbifer sp. JTAC008]|uniref:hypothetical protein n=1 Tax=unclassified Microbulbifer TaxID=2619833 RepID=UPI0040394D57